MSKDTGEFDAGASQAHYVCLEIRGKTGTEGQGCKRTCFHWRGNRCTQRNELFAPEITRQIINTCERIYLRMSVAAAVLFP